MILLKTTLYHIVAVVKLCSVYGNFCTHRSASWGNLHQTSATNIGKVWELSTRVSSLESQVREREIEREKTKNILLVLFFALACVCPCGGSSAGGGAARSGDTVFSLREPASPSPGADGGGDGREREKHRQIEGRNGEI